MGSRRTAMFSPCPLRASFLLAFLLLTSFSVPASAEDISTSCFKKYYVADCPQDYFHIGTINCNKPEDNIDNCIEACQYTCSISKDCTYFTYQVESGSCHHFKGDFISNCKTKVGPAK